MATQQYDYGMIGLGTMGRNLVYNICEHGYSVAGFDKDLAKVEALERDGGKLNVYGAKRLDSFLESLKTPRVIMLLIPAGKAVDAVIDELKPFLSNDDLLIDCGNSHFTDTDLRIERLWKENIHFMGVGVSGGEYGARFGPSIMPGGSQAGYDRIAPMFKAIAAKVNSEPCVTYLGPGSAGHYVKMVHNGIEYGIMQLISETYHLMKVCLDLNNEELCQVFSKWNAGILQSYLIEITSKVLAKKDDLSGHNLVDRILDKAKQNGTGQWTSQNAMDLYLSIPSIDAAVAMRNLSAIKDERGKAQEILSWYRAPFKGQRGEFIERLEHALYFSVITIYAQGMALLQQASRYYKYNLNLADIARVWRGGCIIRSVLLDNIRVAFESEPGLKNLMISPNIAPRLLASQDAIRMVIMTGVESGVPMPAAMASLAYYDAYRSAWLPANLIQAQRDYFGAHTYERNDKEGIFHTQWDQNSN